MADQVNLEKKNFSARFWLKTPNQSQKNVNKSN